MTADREALTDYRTGPRGNALPARGGGAAPAVEQQAGPAGDIQLLMLEDVDFKPTLPCESVSHPISPGDEPASWYVHILCPDCGDSKQLVICEPCRVTKLKLPAHCLECKGQVRESWLDFVISIVRI